MSKPSAVPGGEGLHGWLPVACLAVASDRVKAGPFGPYMRCVLGKCECKKSPRLFGEGGLFDLPQYMGIPVRVVESLDTPDAK